MSQQLGEFLQGDDVQAVLHELLAARLTNAPEAEVARIHAVFDLALTLALPELASAGTGLFSYYDGQICELADRLKKAEPAMLAQLRAEALTARMIAILGAIERHAATLSPRASRQGEAVFLARYRRHVIEHHGQIDPPDFERRLRVSLADLYVPPIITLDIDTQPPEKPREIDVWAFADQIDRTVLLGDPGGGKTTTANVLVHYHASRDGQPLPFLVTLREFAAADPPERSVAGYIEHKLETFYQCPAPPGLVPRLLLTGTALVVFDGLDELLDTARRLEITAIVERFCAEYPLAPVLVTSRVVGYDEARLDDRQFARYRISGFSDDQVSNYVHKWFTYERAIDAAAAARSADAFMEESANVPDLRANPLMLALMCILYRGEGSLPRDRADVYGRCASLLFRKWDTRRRIHLELRAGHLLEPALRHLAWWLFTRGQIQPAVTERQLVEETTTFLHGRGFESAVDARQAAEEFVEFCRGRMWVFADTGTTATGEILYSFTHRTFLEYFAAAHLAYECDTPERLARTLAPHVARHEWEVVGELAVQIKDNTSDLGAQRIYTTLLGERRPRAAAGRGAILQFLARCLRSVDPSPHIFRELTRGVLEHLFGGNADEAVRPLPLCWLLACCDRHRNVVSEEIDARIAQMTKAADPDVRLNGVRLAAFLPFAVLRGDGGPDLSPDRPIRKFWWERTTGLLETYAAPLTAAAADDGGMRFAALWWRVVTMDDALRMPGSPEILFRHCAQGISDGTWAAYLPNAIHWLHNFDPGSETRVAQLVDDLTAFGHYLLAHPAPPWIDDPADDLQFYFPDDGKENTSSLRAGLLSDEAAYLGAAATLLVVAETMKSPKTAAPDRPWQPGPLSDLYPYIEHRWNHASPIQFPDLPVPGPFRQIFRDWANSKTDLIGHGDASAAPARDQPC